MQDTEEPFPQNQEAAKRFKGAQKRKQPGSTSSAPPSTTHPSLSPPPQIHSPQANFASAPSPPPSSISSVSSTTNTTPNKARSLVYQQPVSLQHQQLPSQFLSLDHSTFTSSGPSAYQLYNDPTVATNGGFFAPYPHITSTALPSSSTSEIPSLTNGVASRSSQGQEHGKGVAHGNTVLPGDTRMGQDQDMDLLSTLLAETTLSNTATTPNALDEDDLWGPQIGSAHIAEDVTVPPEMQILPDAETRLQLVDLYYRNHFTNLPMVQREVLRVCEENIHIPHCLLLCNAVYYCGSMFSENTIPLRKDASDEGTVGEDFFQRGQALLEKKYLTTHLCTIQSLLLFAIGHKSPAQRSAFISQAITMALDMGLHSKLDEHFNPFLRAYRARVFWSCYIFDSTTSAINGKPTLINDDEVTVDLPIPGDLGPENETYSDQYFVHCLKGWQICRKIRKNSKLITRVPTPPKTVLLENLDKLDKELVQWQEHLPKVFDLLPIKGCITSDVKALAAGAQLLCYALIILLHHPYLPNPKSPEAFQPPKKDGPPDSQGYCTQAAKEITKIGGLLLKEWPKTFEQNTPARYAMNFAIRIHLRNSKCTVDPILAKESRRDLQRTMDYLEQVESLQFYRINKSKKSDVANLLASCRAALAQQKSSLDLAKEAAALKHKQILQAKQAAKEQQKIQQLQQQQFQQQQYQQMAHPFQPMLPSQILPSQGPQQQQQQQSQQGGLTVSQIVTSMQASQQHPNLQQQSYQQHQQHIQIYNHEHSQQELSRQQMLRRQSELELHRQQHFQQIAQAKQMKKNYYQQQQEQQLQMLRQHHQQADSVLFQGQAAFVHPTAMSTHAFVPFTSQGLSSNNNTTMDAHQQQQQQQAFDAWLASQQHLQMQQSGNGEMTNNDQAMFLGSQNGLAGSGNGSNDEMIDIQAMTFDPRQEALFSTAASNTYQDNGDSNNVQNGLLRDGFLTTTVPRGASATQQTNGTSNSTTASAFSPSPSLLEETSQLSLNSVTSPSPAQKQALYPNRPNPASNSSIPTSSDPSTASMPPTSKATVTPPDATYSSPSASSIISSPGSSFMISEEALLQSFKGQMMQDTFYLNPDLPAEDPRNDPANFVYLPSALEYGDTMALSPGAMGMLDYLTIQEAIQPSRVYSLWNEVFNRVVWRHCSIQDPALQAHHESLAKNAHHIRSLTCNLNATFRAFPVPCPHLASLKLNNREARKDHKGQARVACMVERNTILEELVIYLHSATTARLWGAIKASDHLKRLEVWDANMSHSKTQAWRAHSRSDPRVCDS
ncbi:hypothetical protein BGZ52_011137 [Haplosporangium bisporale]|nr:hypothetical protein BGZ52_011137 [Haplosporangium bisporale]